MFRSYEFDARRSIRQKLRNATQTLGLLAANVGVLAIVSWLIAGVQGLLWAGIGVAVLMLFVPQIGPGAVLRLHGARPLHPYEMPELWASTRELSARADLPVMPLLYVVQSPIPNAFTVGSPSQPAIAVSQGLLRNLNASELQGVLAHEVSHIRNNDFGLMQAAGTVGRIAKLFALVGLVMLALSMPLSPIREFSLLIALTLAAVPFGVDLLQMALSRYREFDADLDAASMTRNPRALASALAKMQAFEGGVLQMLLRYRPAQPSMLRSHPPTEDRIRRLLKLERPTRVFPRAHRVWLA